MKLIAHFSGRKAILQCKEMQPRDVPVTWADAEFLRCLTAYAPQTKLKDGVERFVDSSKAYHGG
jgi:UDP-glucuronate 4-epimerase